MMPPAGYTPSRRPVRDCSRLVHERFTDPEVGRLLEELAPRRGVARSGFRRRRADRTRAPRLREGGERPGVAAGGDGARRLRGAPVWVKAKATSNFALFLPSLERNVELRLRYVDCFDDSTDEPYDVLLDDFEPQMKTAEVRAHLRRDQAASSCADRRASRARGRRLVPRGRFPVDSQVELAYEVVDLFGHRPNRWRIDPTEHPFASGPGIDDIRITTNYYPDSLESLFSTMHEYGHGLYSHQRRSTSSSCRSARHARSGSTSRRAASGRTSSAAAFRSGGSSIRGCRRLPGAARGRRPRAVLRRRSTRSQPSLIRIEADEVTYGMHVMLRFELEQDMVEGRVELQRPAAALEREDVGLPRRRGARRRARRAPGRPLVRRADRLLLDLPARDGDVGADLGGGRRGHAGSRGAGRAAASSRRCASGSASTSTRSAASSPRRRRCARATGSAIDAKPYLDYLRKNYA